ncbi:MAG: prepilin-type N-terminal cleavage/methylation domain-containing protein [Thermoleophilia bacterium]
MTASHTHRQRGFTLVELLLATVMMGILGLAILAFFTSSMRQATTTQAQGQAQSDGRSSLDLLSNELRQAVSPDGGGTPPIISLGQNSIEFYLDPRRDPTITSVKPMKVRYQVTGGALVRDSAAPVGANPPYTYPAYSGAVTLVPAVANTSVAPLFKAYDSNGSALGANISSPATNAIVQLSLDLLVSYRNGNANTTLELNTDVVPRNPRTPR